MPEWDYRNICVNTLHETFSRTDYATSSLLLVLPSYLDAWDNSDSSTHQFRLHFLCDNMMRNNAQGNLPQHVYLSNHPGYGLKRPEEFFQKYGDYILRVLLMVKHGYSDEYYDILSLDTLKILRNCDANIVGSCLTMNIEPLVDRAIS
ncbi:hypothetical protein MVEG_02524 [Podila verticillata NRRL 6337]|nr:hypothetical protein MVEG_02524 [Podila verticillata NRRL 6337]